MLFMYYAYIYLYDIYPLKFMYNFTIRGTDKSLFYMTRLRLMKPIILNLYKKKIVCMFRKVYVSLGK